MAAPAGADLLTACSYSLQHDFQGVEGKLCQWYVTPCDCDYGKQSPPPVCLPPEVAVETLAQKVIDGLQSDPALRTEEAGMAAAIILAEHYPCPENI